MHIYFDAKKQTKPYGPSLYVRYSAVCVCVFMLHSISYLENQKLL